MLVCAGAVWDLVRKEDRPKLRKFLHEALEGEPTQDGLDAALLPSVLCTASIACVFKP